MTVAFLVVVGAVLVLAAGIVALWRASVLVEQSDEAMSRARVLSRSAERALASVSAPPEPRNRREKRAAASIARRRAR